jgi:hypothetical protein
MLIYLQLLWLFFYFKLKFICLFCQVTHGYDKCSFLVLGIQSSSEMSDIIYAVILLFF